MKSNFLIISLFLSLILFSCTEPNEPIDLDDINEYYPLEIGNYWDYRIDSISYIDFTRDSFSSYSREIVVEEFQQNGQPTFLIEEFIGDSLDGQFVYHKTFSVRVENERIIKTYDNLPFIKLVDPIIEGPLYSWSGNGLFSTDSVFLEIGSKNLRLYENWEYFYTKLDTSMMVESNLFDNVVIVNQVDFQTFIDFHQAEESYAKNIGLVSKSLAILQNGQDTTTYEDANYGIVVQKTLLDYGN